MEIPWLSTTVIQGVDDCAWRALESHITRIEHGDDFTGSNPTRFGSIIHEVAEVVHEHDAKGEASPEPLEIFDSIWRSHRLTDRRYFELGRDRISDFIDRNGVTVATEFPFIIDLVELEVWPIPTDITHAKRKAWLKKKAKKIRERGGVPVVSMIDRIDRVSDTEFEIFDYKTNAQPFTRDYVENSLQLALYDMAVRGHWHEAKQVKCTFDLYRHGRQATVFSNEHREEIRSYMINLWHQIKGWEEPEPQLNAFCGWCDYREGCWVYQEAVAGEDLTHPFAPDDLTHVEMFEEFQRFKTVEKLAKDRAEKWGAVIMAGIMDESRGPDEGEPLPLDDEHELYLQLNPRYEYPVMSVLPILQEEGAISMLKWAGSISRPGLDKLIKAKPFKDRIEKTLLTTYARPSLKKRKIKRDPPKKKKRKKKNG